MPRNGAKAAEPGAVPAASPPSPAAAQAVLEQLPDAVLLLDVAGRVVFANWKAGHLLERPASELVGQELVEFELYSSQPTSAQIIWFNGNRHCTSESFGIRQGRCKYLLDLRSLPVLGSIGDPTVRSGDVTRIRLDPTDENNITLALMSLRFCRRLSPMAEGQ